MRWASALPFPPVLSRSLYFRCANFPIARWSERPVIANPRTNFLMRARTNAGELRASFCTLARQGGPGLQHTRRCGTSTLARQGGPGLQHTRRCGTSTLARQGEGPKPSDVHLGQTRCRKICRRPNNMRIHFLFGPLAGVLARTQC